MSYHVPRTEGEVDPNFAGGSQASPGGYPLWEVFVRAKRGLSHVHAGSVHAPDPQAAILAARDVYTRRDEGVSIWVVPSAEIHASDPDQADDWFNSDKPYRHPTFYQIPAEVGHM
jgi:ring-1,2-phenylacetyl-CoA epoxidase subunit PaaB